MYDRAKLRVFFLTPVFIVLFVVATPSFLVASHPAINIELIKDSRNKFTQYEEYSALAGNFYSQFMNLLDSSGQIDSLSRSFLENQITSEYAITKKNVLSVKGELKLRSLNKELSEFTKRNFNLTFFKKASEDFTHYLNTLPDLLRQRFDLSYEIFDAAISRDFELYSDLDVRSRRHLIIILEGENYYMNLQKQNIESNAPAYKLYSTIQHANNISINLIKARISEYFGDSSTYEFDFLTEDSKAYIRVAKIELGRAENVIDASNLVIENWILKIRRQFSGRVSPLYIKTFDSMAESLKKSFKVENDILLVLQLMISTYPNIDIDKFDVLLGELINTRMSLQKERIKLLSNFK
jgi:hypothetical protein